MKKVLLSSVLAVSMATSCYAGFFDAPAVPGLGSSKPAANALSESEVDAIFVAVKNGEKLLKDSTLGLSSILTDSKAKEKLTADLNEAEKIQDPKEREAKIAKVLENAASEMIKMAQSAEGKSKIKKLADNQKKEAGKAIGNFALAGLVDFAAVKMGQDVVQRASADPMGAAMKFAPKLTQIKDIVSTLPTQASQIGTMSQTLFDIAKAGGIPYEKPTEALASAAAKKSDR